MYMKRGKGIWENNKLNVFTGRREVFKTLKIDYIWQLPAFEKITLSKEGVGIIHLFNLQILLIAFCHSSNTAY